MQRYQFPLAAVLLSSLAAPPAPAADSDWFLLTSHVDQRTGLHLSVSADGLKWQAVNGDKPLFRRTLGEVFRDPSIARDAAGVYHLVWTVAWGCGKYKGFGYSSSRDLVEWSPQRLIPVMENEPRAEFIWAPELFWDAAREQWLIHWSSSVTGKFPETLALFNGKTNPRIYYTTTRDFRTFTPSQLLFNGDCLAIDSYLYRAADDRYCMFFKADRAAEPKRGLLMATAPTATGPYTVDPHMITAPEEGWAEAPSVIKVGEEHRMYYAMPGDFGAYESADLKIWTSLRKQMQPPGGYRHGTVIRVSEADARRLLARPVGDPR